MGNSTIPNNKIVSSNNNKSRIIINNKLNNTIIKKYKKENTNQNKLGDLDLFKNIENDTNEFKEITKKGKINNPIIITKNYFVNDENNINFLRMINNNPIKKIKNQMKNNANTTIEKDKEGINQEENKQNLIFKDKSIQNDIKNENIEPNIKKINPNLYELEVNNLKYYNYNDEKDDILKKNDEILSSERTINNTNREGEFFFENTKKNNIFSNIIKYEPKKTKNNTNNKGKLVELNNLIIYKENKFNKINKVKKDNNVDRDNKNKDNKINKVNKDNNKERNDKKGIKEKVYKNNDKLKVKIDNIKSNNNLKYKKIIDKNNKYTSKNNSVIRIHNTNNNNLLMISSFLTNNSNSRNKIDKFHSSYRNNRSYNIKENKNIHKNYNSFKNLSNNIISIPKTKINSYNEEENNNLKLKKPKKNIYNRNTIPNKISNNNFSYNYNNYYIYNDKNNNFYEKQKMAELIEKIPNNELKNEIMDLYQKIINYKNEIIINSKNSKYNYIITFSHNYIKINENDFPKKGFNRNNFLIKNPIKISLVTNKNKLSKNKNSLEKINDNNAKKSKSIKLISNIQKDSKLKSGNKNLKNNKNNNLTINAIDNDSIFKKFTFEQYKKSGNAKLNSAKINFQLTSSKLNSKLKSIYTTSSKSENNKIKINTINNKEWKKIINLNEVIINKDKIFPFTVIEKNISCLTNIEALDDLKKRNNSLTFKPKKEKSKNLPKANISKSFSVFKYNENFHDMEKFEKFYTFSLGKEKIIFQKNMKKLIKVKKLLKDIKKFQKNYVFKEEDLIIFNSICFLSKDYIIIFKDKEKNYPLFKKKISLMRKIMSFKKSQRFIIIIEFCDLNCENGKRENYEKDKLLGLLIDKEKDYNEFIELLTQLNNNLEIIFLN